jgi:hypothetical protein
VGWQGLVGWVRRGVDGDLGGGYKRGPRCGRQAGGGLLIEIVWMGRDARAAARVAGASRILRAFWRPCYGSVREGICPLGCVSEGWAWDELESLILAQNERWRHA